MAHDTLSYTHLRCNLWWCNMARNCVYP